MYVNQENSYGFTDSYKSNLLIYQTSGSLWIPGNIILSSNVFRGGVWPSSISLGPLNKGDGTIEISEEVILELPFGGKFLALDHLPLDVWHLAGA